MSIRSVVPISQADWGFAPAPEWVEPRLPDWEFEAPEEHGVAILLADHQCHVATRAVARRTVSRVLTHAAVQALGQVNVDFDPSAERLRIHEIAVWRRGEAGVWSKSAVAHPDSFLIRQREQRLEEQMLDGRASVVALLEDLRAGDAIDLAWTIEPLQRLPGLRFCAFHAFAWQFPVGAASFSVHIDPAEPVRWRMHAPAGAPVPARDPAPTREGWTLRRPPMVPSEPNAPPGDWNFPVLDVSGWTDWGEVSGFVAGLWADALADSPARVAETAARLRVPGDLAASAAAAIRFAQSEVRYLAVDFGEGSGMLPSGAGTVLRRRFGDCKDKAVLLTALLRTMGCEAWPMLVNPAWQRALPRLQPSTAAFNHAIVTFLLAGHRYFVDPTFLGHRGDLAHLVPPPHGCGLEVRPGAPGLLPIPPRPEASLSLTESFHLDHRRDEGAVEQVLRATSWLADEVRAAVAREGQAAFFKARAAALQGHFPALVSDVAGGRLTEDEGSNAIEVRMRHALPTWGPKEDGPPATFAYGAHGLALAVEPVEGPAERTLAWALRHPMRIHHRVLVRGRRVRRPKPETFSAAGPGFRYDCDVSVARGEVAFDYRWETTRPEVAPGEWPEYCRERARAFGRAGALLHTLPFWSRDRVAFGLLVAICFAIGYFRHVDPRGPGAGAPAAQRADPARVESEMMAAWDSARRGEFAAAEPVFERHREHFRRNPAFHLMRAEIGVRLNLLERARQALADARALDPDNPAADVLDALICRADGDLQRARSVLEGAASRFPNNAPVSRNLAEVLEQLGDARAARDAWGRLLALSPGDADGVLHYCLLLWQGGDRDHADEVITGVVRAQPAPSPLLEAALGEYFAATGRNADALAAAERAAKLAPMDPAAAFRLASFTLRVGDHARAMELASEMSRRFPNEPRSWYALSLAASVAMDVPAASRAYEEWLRVAPRDPDAHSNYGFFLHQLHRDAEAREVLQRACREFPGYGLAWLNLSVVLEALGDQAAAKDARQKADALLPTQQRHRLIR